MSRGAGHRRRAQATIRSASCVSTAALTRVRIAPRFVRRGPRPDVPACARRVILRLGRADLNAPGTQAAMPTPGTPMVVGLITRGVREGRAYPECQIDVGVSRVDRRAEQRRARDNRRGGVVARGGDLTASLRRRRVSCRRRELGICTVTGSPICRSPAGCATSSSRPAGPEPHHVLPDSGWVTLGIGVAGGVDQAIELFRLSYERAVGARRARAGSAPASPSDASSDE